MLDTVTETTSTVFLARRLAVLDAIGNAVASATDAEAIMTSTTQLLAQHLQVSICAYADMDEDEDGFTIRGDWAAQGSPSIIGHYSLAAFGERAVSALRAGQPLVIRDNLIELPADESATFQALGVTATICVPLIKDGRLTALMAVHDKQPRYWSPYDLALLGEVTERSWAHIERVRADAAVREGLAAYTELNATLEQRVEERTLALAQAEAALRQSQKLEAIGQLTGGVAHDFNNLLTIIRSSVDFLRQPNLSQERRQRYMSAVSDTVERASKLTSQLLAFARRQPLNPQVLDVSQRVRNIGEMLESVTGARIHVQVQLPDQPCYARIDPSQLETALLNIALNARDAMDGQGTLTLKVATQQALPRIRGDAESRLPYISISDRHRHRYCRRHHRPYLRAVLHHQGRWQRHRAGPVASLRLCQTVGRQHRCDKYPRPGHCVHLVFAPSGRRTRPAAGRTGATCTAAGGCPTACADRGRQPGSGTFRQPDPQGPGLQDHLGDQRRAGTRPRWRRRPSFRRDFSDVVMPGMTGVAMARLLRERRLDLPVVLVSGYSEELADSGYEGFEFLAKPYSAEQVARALVRAMSRDQTVTAT